MIEKLISPMGERQPFIWIANYINDYKLTEFENDGKENLFNTIVKSKLDKFGLLGRGVKLYYDVSNGIFHMFDKKVEFSIESENEIINLTSNDSTKYNDIITYKSFYRDFDPIKKSSGPTVIDGYFFGYKCNIIEKDTEIHFKVIFAIPIGNTMRFGIHLASNKGIKGSLVIKINDKIDKRIDLDLEPNEGKDFESLFIV